ncbi:hypothetical protein [Microcystis aeruginosa]|uniref:Uncharacterized protein n=1 Tax=Microcystis aeruginosa NIES-2521 TaxID=2303983 RepID=A0A5A5RWV2_MICAE|nr:hypothetical protein [Microcystis aeruginosa]GCA80610.1 hypothetical protein MiTs_02619 [Microcystis aeruginosa NIES-2521]
MAAATLNILPKYRFCQLNRLLLSCIAFKLQAMKGRLISWSAAIIKLIAIANAVSDLILDSFGIDRYCGQS